MSMKDRIAIFPSRANHVAVKGRIVSANKGLSLLRRKRDALELKLREINALRAGLAENFQELFSEALFSIAKANFLETDFKPALVMGSEHADAYMRLTYSKTIGLLLPKFEPVIRKPESLPFTGLARGGQQVDVIRDKFQELLRTIILLASYDYSIRTLQDSIRTNNMRLNGLEFVLLPRFYNTAAYISDELDEMEREEFYRLKCSQGKQRSLKEKGKLKKPLERKFADAETWTGEDQLKEEEEERFVPLPLSIFMKKKYASNAQTIITGHFPGSLEVISPTDSVVSGIVPTVSKRSSFRPLNYEPKATPVTLGPNAQMATTTPILSTAPMTTVTPSTGLTRSMSLSNDHKVRPATKDSNAQMATTTPTLSTAPMTTATSPTGSIRRMSSGTSLKQSKRVSLAEEENTFQMPTAFSDSLSGADAQSHTSGAFSANATTKNENPAVPASNADPSANATLTSSSKPSPFSFYDKNPSANSPTDEVSEPDLGETSVETSSALIDIKHFNDPSFSKAPSASLHITSLHEMSVQTDITGRYPRRGEMDLPPDSWASDAHTARSQTIAPGRQNRGNNTEHGDTSASDDEETENPRNVE